MAEEKGKELSDAAIEKQDPSGVNAAREERADTIEAINEADAESAKAEQKAADAESKPIKTQTKTKDSSGRPAKRTAPKRTAPRHVVKRDDEGAAEQQRSARRAARDAGVPQELDGPPVVAPIIEEDLPITFKIIDSLTGRELEDELWVTMSPRIYGDDFPAPGEVILDVRREDGQDHQRFSTYTYDGTIDVALPGVNGPGTWIFHAEAPVTKVGEGRDDHLPVIRQSDEVQLIVR